MSGPYWFVPPTQLWETLSKTLLLATFAMTKSDLIRVVFLTTANKKKRKSSNGDGDMGRKTFDEIIRVVAIRRGEM